MLRHRPPIPLLHRPPSMPPSSSYHTAATPSPPPSSTATASSTGGKRATPPPPLAPGSTACRHSPAATLDLIILVLVLFSCAFLIASSLSHIARSVAPFLSPLAPAVGPAAAAAALTTAAALACRKLLLPRRRCRNPRCRGLKKALEFDVQLQTEESVRAGGGNDPMWKEIDALPWKGGQSGNNPDYECLRAELRKMAPVNGRAVLLFRSRCGCPVAKLEGWGSKRGRRLKK